MIIQDYHRADLEKKTKLFLRKIGEMMPDNKYIRTDRDEYHPILALRECKNIYLEGNRSEEIMELLNENKDLFIGAENG